MKIEMTISVGQLLLSCVWGLVAIIAFSNVHAATPPLVISTTDGGRLVINLDDPDERRLSANSLPMTQ